MLTKAAIRTNVLAMQGETEEAIDVAVSSVFSESVLLSLNWRESLALDHFKQVVADNRVQVAMQRWADEQAMQTEQVRTFLADLSAGQ